MMVVSDKAKTMPTPAPMAGPRVVTAHLQGGIEDAAVLHVAGQIAELSRGHVIATHVRSAPPSIDELAGYPANALHGLALSPDEEMAAERAAAAHAGFEAWRQVHAWPVIGPTPSGGPTVAYAEIDGDEPTVLTERSRLSDIVVTCRPALTGIVTFDALLRGCGHPVLMVPPRWSGDVFGGTAVVTWNGSMQAARALAAAVPLLRATAGDVLVFSVSEHGGPASAHRVSEYLEWHDIRSTVAKTTGTEVSLQLLELAEASGAGLIVGGAYSHSRLRQILFGGVTAHLIERAEIPVLFAG